jgi:CheY-like chemotaxis protein
MFWANDAAVQLWAAESLKELLDRNFKDMSEATLMRLEACMEHFHNGETLQEQWTLYPKGTSSVVVNCTIKGIPLEEGRIAMLVHGKIEYGSLQTTTEIADKEKEVLRATEMMRQLPLSSCMIDLQGNILQQNPECLASFGTIPKQEQNPPAFVRRFVNQDEGRQLIHRASQEQENKAISLLALQHTVHGQQWSFLNTRRTRDPVTSKPVLLCTAQDVTDIVQNNQPSNDVQALADMVRAMRTPLQHILGVVELLQQQQMMQKGNDPKNNDCLRLLLASTQQVMTDILNFTALVDDANHDKQRSHNDQTSTAKPNRQKLDLGQVVTKAVDAVQQDFGNTLPIRTVMFSRSINDGGDDAFIPHGSAEFWGDADRLYTTIVILLKQAARVLQTDPSDNVSIIVSVKRLTGQASSMSSRRRRCWIRLEFKLNGCRGSSQAEEEEALRQCQILVQEMGGELLHVDGSHDGVWTSIDVPLHRISHHSSLHKRKRRDGSKDRPSAGPTSAPLETVPDVEGEGGMRILLVDETGPAGRNVMGSLLEELGHTVTMVESGEDMMQSVMSGSFDAVLVETHLERKDDEDDDEIDMFTALEASKQLRLLGYSPETLPVIVLTGDALPSDYVEMGLNGWLTKPVSVRDIQKAITNAICNTGGSMSGGSLGSTSLTNDDSTICTWSLYEKQVDRHDLDPSSPGTTSLRSMQQRDTSPVMPRRGSFGSVTGEVGVAANG